MLRPRFVLSLAACTAVAAAGFANAATSSSPAAPVALAPVLGSAVKGGAVIVELKNQHTDLNLRTQGAKRIAAAQADQKPIIADILAHHGTALLPLVSVNGVAATLSAAEVQRLRTFASVKQIVPDPTFTIGDSETSGPTAKAAQTAKTAATNPFTSANSCGTKAAPLVEPEALSLIKAPAMTDKGATTEPGYGVIVANAGLSNPATGDVVGNPNFDRPAADGGGTIIDNAIPGDTTDSTDGEYYGDASSIAAQGTVEYQYSKELPYSGLPSTCYFKLVGDAPGVQLLDTGESLPLTTIPTSAAAPAATPGTMTMAQEIAGVDASVSAKADVVNESYGYSTTPGMYQLFYEMNRTAVTAGETVVVSSGDSGDSGTVSSPASDPDVIAAGATNSLRENAMAYGYKGWVNNDITPLSSGGTTPNEKLVDLVAIGYGGEAACNPKGSDCPTNTQTEAFGGTSEAAPLVAGGAADVIAAYKSSHGGTAPTPQMVKELLTSTAQDIDAPADQQGAGLLDITAAMAAARNSNGGSGTTGSTSLLAMPTQLNIQSISADRNTRTVTLYNTSNKATTVTGTFRSLSTESQIGKVVTEKVSAPAKGATIPSEGAQAASDVTFTVPKGLARLDADMIWPDSTNSNILNYVLTDPQGRLRNISYDYGTAGSPGSVPNIQHTEVADPTPGTWTAHIKWGNGRSHLQEEPNVPGTYRGTISFKVAGQKFVTSKAVTKPVTIKAHSSAQVKVVVLMPAAPGDHPESIQFVAANGAKTSLPVARRTLIPAAGGTFTTAITSTVGRGVGQVSTFVTEVATGTTGLNLTFTTPDASADDGMTVYVVNPDGVATNTVDLAPTTANGKTADTASFTASTPTAGRYEIDVSLNLTVSGKEFTQYVTGHMTPS